jgi:aryl-phospho-beta-D-glucosidase BglC (GH1 family)
LKRALLITFILLLTFSCKTGDDSDDEYEYRDYGVELGEPDKTFIHVKGNTLVIGEDETEILLRGINFENGSCSAQEIPGLDLQEIEYQRVHDMGMNVIRFCMYYGTFENDSNPYSYKQSGWDYLNEKVQFAKNNGIYLILGMHYPPGGLQSDAGGFDLWDIRENQTRLVALWKEIAYRYREEKTIAGFDLVNEPLVSESVDQWKDLANEIIREIREVDNNHLIIVEQLLAVGPNYEHMGDQDYITFLVDDPYNNVMYDFHFYNPFEFTHEGQGNYPGDWDQSYLESCLLETLQFSISNNVPMSVGEFGLRWDLVPAVDAEAWTRDLLDLFDQNSLNWTYWCYHGWYFGIYTETDSLPVYDERNTTLIKIFEDF